MSPKAAADDTFSNSLCVTKPLRVFLGFRPLLLFLLASFSFGPSFCVLFGFCIFLLGLATARRRRVCFRSMFFRFSLLLGLLLCGVAGIALSNETTLYEEDACGRR